MTTIGIYDSGIGGLSTLALLQKSICGVNYYYLADNQNMPFGSKSNDEITEIVNSGIAKIKANSDICVLACNTASITTSASDVFKLLPEHADMLRPNSLLLATPLTLSHMVLSDTCAQVVNTKELATLVEIQASLAYKTKQILNMSSLSHYLMQTLKKIKNIENIVLGCSHYAYLKDELIKIFGNVNFYDGNAKLILEVMQSVEQTNCHPSISFNFTGHNEAKKYDYILHQLSTNCPN